MRIKRIFLFVLFLLSIFVCSCFKKEITSDDFFVYCFEDANEISIGRPKTYPENHVVYMPYYVSNVLVTSLGHGPFGSCFFINRNGDDFIEKVYIPSSINEIVAGYMNLSQNNYLKVFYCSMPINLGLLESSEKRMIIYVPMNEYDEFVKLSVNDFVGTINKANVVYDINYDGGCHYNNYYYIDYVNNNEQIINIPPTPTRDSYIFSGWYKEKECINKWDFNTDVINVEDGGEMRLFANWDKK